jgi:UDP-N-acetylglucosamine 1-carboxyvinyltransferase
VDKIVIEGGRPLEGEVAASGAKNAALPLLFAALLTETPCRLRGVPDVADIRTACTLLESLGAVVRRPAPGEIELECSRVQACEAPYDLVRKMRASFLVLGPLLARYGRARVSQPGGCAIGSRPVDQHVAGMRRLGARISHDHGYVEATARELRGGHVIFSAPSVGATENVLMAAALARGSTRIENAAREPEIVDLADALGKMGAQISGAGSSVIDVEGVSSLGGFDHEVIPDRIEAGTFLIAAAVTRGDVIVRRARASHLAIILEALQSAGARVETGDDYVRVTAAGRPAPVDVTTAPHPGFPTDLQAQFMVLMCLSTGRSTIQETIFENRFMHVQELARMGADIRLSGHEAVVKGQVSLSGAPVMATDLRASVCLVLAGMAAEQHTEVLRIYHLDRGYEHIEAKLSALGARIRRVPAERTF